MFQLTPASDLTRIGLNNATASIPKIYPQRDRQILNNIIEISRFLRLGVKLISLFTVVGVCLAVTLSELSD
jgi:hypothetical protein